MSFVSVDEEKDIFKITLDRPEVRNAFNAETIAELTSAFVAAEKSSACAVYLSGAGKSFCAGADLAWMKSMKDFSFKENEADSEKLFEMFEAGRNCSLPIVCRAHGHVMGGATGLLAISDVVIAEEHTQFAFSEVKLGLAPATISPFVLRKMQANKGKELMLTGRKFLADEALASGLIEKVSSESEIDQVVEVELNCFKELGPQAVRETKRLINKVSNPMFNGLKEETAKVIAGVRVGDEGQEGLAAFFEKRSPSWKREV